MKSDEKVRFLVSTSFKDSVLAMFNSVKYRFGEDSASLLKDVMGPEEV